MAKRRAWVIKNKRGVIHLDKICVSKSEAWGLLSDELDTGMNSPTNAEMRAQGYECVRVEIRDAWR